jgi:hypothetical protein
MRAAIAVLLTLSLAARGEQGVLVVSVRTAADTPLSGVRIGTVGDGSTVSTDDTGRGRIRLSPETGPGASDTLQVVPPPDLVLISPWGGRTPVPPFENESDNYIQVILVRRGDRRALENAAVLAAVIAQSVSRKPSARSPRHKPGGPGAEVHRPGPIPVVAVGFEQSAAPGSQSSSERRPLITEQAAQELGFTKSEVQQALDHWEADKLFWKIIVLTGRVEFGGRDPFSSVTGGFDGMSFGIGSWSVRSGTLMPLLSKMRSLDLTLFDQIMAPDQEFVVEWLKQPAERALELTRQRMLAKGSSDVSGLWKTRFATLGRTPEFQRVQVDELRPRMEKAREVCVSLGLHSERALAFIFDTAFSQGLGFTRYLAQDQEAFARVITRQPDEEEKLLLLVNRASNRVPVPLREQLRQRYLAFATGEGVVFGSVIDLDQAGLGMFDLKSGEPIPLVDDAATRKRLTDGWLPSENRSNVDSNL